MKQLISEFNSEYRNYSAIGYNNYQFTEDDNKGKPDTLQSLTILGIDACVIPKSIIKDSTSIYAKANSQDILRKDNDGIFLKEENGKKYIMPEANCKRSFFPLHVPEITIYHISVPDKTENYTIDFNDII